MKKKTTVYHLLTTALFICLVLSFSVTYLVNAFLNAKGSLAPNAYNGIAFSANHPIDYFHRTVYQNKAALDFVREYEYRLFGIVSSNNVVAGKNHFLFQVEDAENGYNYLKDYIGEHTFTEEESAAILEELLQRKRSYAARNCQYLLVILPNTQTVYSENMPSYLGKISENTRLAVLDDYLRTKGFQNFINMTVTLRTQKNPELPFYNNTENSLNALGLYYAYLLVCASFSDNAYEYENLISRNTLQFYQHYTEGRSLAKQVGLEKVVENHTVSLAKETRLDYRILFDSGYAAKTVRNDYGGIAANSVSSLLLQFSNSRDRLLSEVFFSNTYDFVTYQTDLTDNEWIFERAQPSVVVQFIYENELSMLLPPQAE